MTILYKSCIKLFVLLFLVIVLNSCQSGNKPSKAKDVVNSRFKLETFEINDGWGYQVKINGVVKFRQKSVPGVPGNNPFDTEIEAKKVGDLVIKKLHGEGLPTITKQELDSLQIRY